MARDKELLALRDARIRKVYEQMRRKRKGGRPVYTVDYILYVISTKHVFVSVRQIRRVLWGD